MHFKKYTLLLLFIVGLIAKTSAQDIYSQFAANYGVVNSLSTNYDKSMIVFTSKNDGVWKMYFTTKDKPNAQWAEVAPLNIVNELLQPEEYIEGSSFHSDGTQLYFSVVNPEQNTGDIYVTQKNNGAWGAPNKLPATINTDVLEGSPSITPDGNSLFFTRKNPDPDEDDYDARYIYISEKDKDGQWKRSYKLPKLINTDCEFGPRIMPDSKTLVFSSVRKKIKKGDQILLAPKGGFDLYFATRLAEKIWTAPKHISEFSSGNDDLFFTYDLQDKLVLSTSIIEKSKSTTGVLSKKSQAELKSLTIDPVYVLFAQTKDEHQHLQNIQYKVYDPYSSQQIAAFNTGHNKKSTICLPNNKNYRMEVTAKGYSKTVKIINLANKPLKENSYNKVDFQIQNAVKLNLNVYDNSIYEPLTSRIIITDAQSGEQLSISANSIGRGIYQMTLPIGKTYKIIVSKKTYESQTLDFDLSGDVLYFNFEKDIELNASTKELEITVEDSETNEMMEVDVVVTNLDKNETIYLKAKRSKNGKFTINLREGDRYRVKVKNPKGYAYYTTEVNMSSRQQKSKLAVELVPLKAQTKLELKAITFEVNSAELRKSSFEELNRVVELLVVNPELKVEISAHSDDKGSNAYNQKLSERRAQSVVAYLQEQGLVPEKLVAKGYGETRPLVPNDNDVNRAKNRRVELEILERNAQN